MLVHSMAKQATLIPCVTNTLQDIFLVCCYVVAAVVIIASCL